MKDAYTLADLRDAGLIQRTERYFGRSPTLQELHRAANVERSLVGAKCDDPADRYRGEARR